jgi:hypothetical protein
LDIRLASQIWYIADVDQFGWPAPPAYPTSAFKHSDEQLRDFPFAAQHGLGLNSDILNQGVTVIIEDNPAVQQFSYYQSFDWPLLKAAHINQPG